MEKTPGDGQALLLRPAMGADDVYVRELFHHLSERDVYTRFFRKVRGLSRRDAQRLCNLNLETEVQMSRLRGVQDTSWCHHLAFVATEVPASTCASRQASPVRPGFRPRVAPSLPFLITALAAR